jgi:hypothetical protein
LLLLLVGLLFASGSFAESGGITGDRAEGGSDVAKAGCTCHTDNEISPTDSVALILEGVPYGWAEGVAYEMKVQLLGGPEIDTTSNTGGFSMRASSGVLSAGNGFDGLVQNDGSEQTLTHTSAGAKTADRTWHIVWTAPAAGSGEVTFWLAGNSVDGNKAPMAPDSFNRLSFPLPEGGDSGATRTIFAADGEVEAPAAEAGHTDLHSMGAPFRAHWLGLLGFASVISLIIFCGLFLRYGFSHHYVGRSNLLHLRIKHLRRGDQL